MYNVKKGDICYINLDDENLVGCEQGGMRPCVIVQNNVGNKYSQTIIVALMTSNIDKRELPTHMDVPKRGHLEKDSVIMTEQLKTVDKSRVRHKIARLSKQELKQLDKTLRISLGILGGEELD